MNRKLGDHALVLGGSMAGLLTARVLAEAFDRVTVVDRDTMPQIGEHRRGVPHGRHAHVLLTRGQRILEELFPGLTADLVHQGVPTGDLLGDAQWCLNGHRLRQADTGLTMLCASRPLLEGTVRARVLTLPGITLLDGCDVTGLATTADQKRVTGARVVRRADGKSAELVAADLVVDATGRGSRTPLWLEELGYQAAEVEHVRVGMGYSTRTYRISRDAVDRDLLIANGASPGNARGGVLICLEGDRAIVTLAGRLGDDPSTDGDGFLAFARSLQFPDIYDRIRAAQPLDDPVGFRFPASVRRRYERLRCFPAGLLVTGDAVCSFNPQYGQGMSVAALHALALRHQLDRDGVPAPTRFFQKIARAIDAPWAIAAGSDLAFPGVQGRRTARTRLANRYMARLHAAAAADATLAGAFIRVAGLVDPPERLLRPELALRVVRGTLRRRPAQGRLEPEGRPNLSMTATGTGRQR